MTTTSDQTERAKVERYRPGEIEPREFNEETLRELGRFPVPGEHGRWVENDTALFLPDVQRDGSDEAYVVTAVDGTNFSITAKRLFIVHAGGREEIQPAVG